MRISRRSSTKDSVLVLILASLAICFQRIAGVSKYDQGYDGRKFFMFRGGEKLPEGKSMMGPFWSTTKEPRPSENDAPLANRGGEQDGSASVPVIGAGGERTGGSFGGGGFFDALKSHREDPVVGTAASLQENNMPEITYTGSLGTGEPEATPTPGQRVPLGSTISRQFRKMWEHPRMQKISERVQDYFYDSLEKAPALVIEALPTCSLKVRKTMSPLRLVTLTLGVDYCFQLSTWRFTGECEDNVLGMRLNMVGSELQATKVIKYNIFASEEKVAKIKMLGAYDLTTNKGYARLSVRSERLSNFDLRQFYVPYSFTLDPKRGSHTAIELKTEFRLPEPEIILSTEKTPPDQRTHQGLTLGDIYVGIEEVNLVLTY